MTSLLPQETIRRKRDGASLSAEEIRDFVQGLASGKVGDAQAGAFAMAVCCRGMDTAEAVALTLAMRDSGDRLDWSGQDLNGPVVDKHSTGGVGDTVSLMLGPMLAACGCHVPMISGRGLGHTGGTLDKLEAIPGYQVQVPIEQLQRIAREVGVAIVGASERLAPADRRLYAVRDVTATIESVPLITASILSKKLAAGLGGLVLDVKYGSGAFMPDIATARELAQSLVTVGCGAGLPTRALLTDMNEPLASAAGNALEVQLTIDYLCGRGHSPRLHQIVLALGAILLQQAGVAASEAESVAALQTGLDTGRAAERFARMVSALGGPADLLEHPQRHLAQAPVRRPVFALIEAGATMRVAAIATRDLGLALLQLGGGRLQPGDAIDPAVGLSGLLPLGSDVDRDTPLAWVHAADEAAAESAIRAVQQAYRLAEAASPWQAAEVVGGRVDAEGV